MRSCLCLLLVMLDKLVIKCGNFAVLVDLHVLPRGTSKDTSWFSVQEKEEVCVLLKDTIEWRVRQHAESHKQPPGPKHQEYTQSSPLFLKEMHVFPDRFVVCASQLETDPSLPIGNANNAASRSEDCSSGTSRYFTERRGNETSSTLSNTPKKQAVLRNIVKKTESTKDSCCTTKPRADGEVFPCLGLTDTRDEGTEDQPPTNVRSPGKCRSAAKPEDCTNTTENSLVLPLPEVENHVNRPLPFETISQQNQQYTGSLKEPKLGAAPSQAVESAVPEEKQSLVAEVTQHKRRRHSSDGKTRAHKKADLRDDLFVCLNGKINYESHGTNADVDLLRSSSFSNPSADAMETTKTRTTDKLQELTKTAKMPLQTGTGELVAQTRTGELVAQTRTGELVAQTRTGELVAQTRTGELVARNRTGELVAQTRTGELVARNRTGELVAQTSTGELVAQTRTGELVAQTRTGELVAQTRTGELVAQTRTGELVARNRTGELVAQTSTGELVAQTRTGELVAQTRTGELVAQTRTGELVAQNETGELVVQTGTGELVVKTGPGELVAQTGTGELVAQTGPGELVAQTGPGELVAQTGTGELVAQTGTGELVAQTGTGELVAQTGTGELVLQTGELVAQTGTGGLLEQTGICKLVEQPGTGDLVEQTGTGDLADKVVTQKRLDHTGKDKLMEQNCVGNLPKETRPGNLSDPRAKCKPPQQTDCRSEHIRSHAMSLASSINTGRISNDHMKATEHQPKKLKLQRAKKGQ
uniref:Uncharacterized protein n=2 Tax=Leptobrachium leishanense TaxID=445787 RepID=A0A8C5MMP9_9ANUR